MTRGRHEMGFKCPICQKDFAKDRDAWSKHCTTCCGGAAGDIVKLVTDLGKKPDDVVFDFTLRRTTYEDTRDDSRFGSRDTAEI